MNVDYKTYECKARGVFRKDGMTPLPGDRVLFTVTDENGEKGFIDEILLRKSVLARPAVANVDQVIAVIAACSPDPDLLLLDKLLITASRKDLDVFICINKIDLDPVMKYGSIIAAYEKAGYFVVPVSSKTDTGYDCLISKLKGRVSVMAGQSGVGKSTILNKITGSLSMETGDISGKIMRGRHTTRHAQLFELDSGGYIVDTPGFSLLDLPDTKPEELQFYYPEFHEFSCMCRFRGCSHIAEPGCLVKESVNSGKFDFQRYQRYILLYNALKQNKTF